MKWGVCVGAWLLALGCLAAEAFAQEADGATADGNVSSTAAKNDYSANRYAIAIYGGYLTTQVFSELYSGPNKLVNSKFVAVSLSRELISVGHVIGVNALAPLKLEAEGIAALHMGQWPESQTFSEFVGALNLRWHRFPWNRRLLTTMGIGEGLSYAAEKPSYEVEINNKSAHLMNFLMFDVTFAHPDLPELALLLRLHHRSGAFGLFDGVTGGSNFFTVGLKYTF